MNEPRVLATDGAGTTLESIRSKSRIVFADLPYDGPVRRRPDISLTIEQVAWRPTVPLAERLRRTIDYFDDVLAAGAQAAPKARERSTG